MRDASYDLAPTLRVELLQKLGPSAVSDLNDLHAFAERMKVKEIPVLTSADRVRARISILSAQKVAALWQQACHETELANDMSGGPEDSPATHLVYFQKLQAASLEDFSVYDVPRLFIPQHILAMAELVMQSRVRDAAKFRSQVNEWWQIYTRPFRCGREFSIKWAAQEALYLTMLWQRYLEEEGRDYSIDTHDLNEYAYNQTHAPAGYAMLAYAGIFDQDDKIVDPVKRQEFWLWWLGWAIPTAIELESDEGKQGLRPSEHTKS